MEGGLTWSGKNTMQYIGDVLQNCTPETYIILLTNVTPINSIKIKKKELSTFIAATRFKNTVF